MNLYLKTKDYSVSGESFQLMHQPESDMLITVPQPKDLGKYYESELYISHTDSNKGVVDKMYQGIKKYSLHKKTKLIGSYSKTGKNLLDVGAGTGDFLVFAEKKGWNPVGVEPNEKARSKALEKGMNLYSSLDDLKGKRFDLITLWHVLEHLPNLELQIEQLKKLLHNEGTLIVAVPNFKSYDAKYYKNFWAAYDVPRHLWHFSKNAITHLFSKQGMKLIRTEPMIFDAFYVSLLSEKYKTGKQNLFKAFAVGLRSNLCAWRNKEYSSLIYIIKKA